MVEFTNDVQDFIDQLRIPQKNQVTVGCPVCKKKKTADKTKGNEIPRCCGKIMVFLPPETAQC